MNTIVRNLTLAALALGSLAALAQSTKTPQPAPTPQSAPTPAAAKLSDPGERAFQVNCSRCHNAPEQLNPRITGTVVRHMRVRANLSAADERAILRFFNP